MKHKDAKHEFAVYISHLKEYINQKNVGELFGITDADAVHRMVRVLRMQKQHSLILFDGSVYVQGIINEIYKHEVQLKIVSLNTIQSLKPSIMVLLPLLKRDHLDAAIYSLVEMGVSTIQLIKTAKMQRVWGKDKEFERLQRIMIGAAEQSKNFALPTLYKPRDLADFLDIHGLKIFFDPDGDHLKNIWGYLDGHDIPEISLLVGPEGDLTQEEKEIIRKKGFRFCRLTPTILRAHQAIALAAGIVRSLLS